MPNVVATASAATTDVLESVSTATSWINKGLTSLDNYTDKALYHSMSVSDQAKHDYEITKTTLDWKAKANAARRITEFKEDLAKDLADDTFRARYDETCNELFGEQHNMIPADLKTPKPEPKS